MLRATICGAENLRCMERNGPFRALATAFVDKNYKPSTQVDEVRDRYPIWNETLLFPLVRPIDGDTTLKIVIYDDRNDGSKNRIGSAKLKLWEVVNKVEYKGNGYMYTGHTRRTLTLTRRSFRSRGHVVVEISIEIPVGLAPQPGPSQSDCLGGFARGFFQGMMIGNGINS